MQQPLFFGGSMETLNNLLINLRHQWLASKQIDINTLVATSNAVRLLNRKENKPLKITLRFYKLNNLQTIKGICTYLNLLVGNNIINSYLTGEIKIWKKTKKISYGKTVRQKINILKRIKIPIYNLVEIQSATIPSCLKKYI
jgi:hypothetical protein